MRSVVDRNVVMRRITVITGRLCFWHRTRSHFYRHSSTAMQHINHIPSQHTSTYSLLNRRGRCTEMNGSEPQNTQIMAVCCGLVMPAGWFKWLQILWNTGKKFDIIWTAHRDKFCVIRTNQTHFLFKGKKLSLQLRKTVKILSVNAIGCTWITYWWSFY